MTTLTSQTTKAFREMFRALPDDVQRAAKKSYSLWRQNPQHPSLQFKAIRTAEPIFSVRVSLGWRACAVREDETFIWFFIGSHAAYDRVLSQL